MIVCGDGDVWYIVTKPITIEIRGIYDDTEGSGNGTKFCWDIRPCTGNVEGNFRVNIFIISLSYMYLTSSTINHTFLVFFECFFFIVQGS